MDIHPASKYQDRPYFRLTFASPSSKQESRAAEHKKFAPNLGGGCHLTHPSISSLDGGLVGLRFTNPRNTNENRQDSRLAPGVYADGSDDRDSRSFFRFLGLQTASPWCYSGIEHAFSHGSLNCSCSLGVSVTGMPPTEKLGTRLKRTSKEMRENQKGAVSL